MKIIIVFLFATIFSFSASATNPALETTETSETQITLETEFSNVLGELFETKSKINLSENIKNCTIIIIDSNFNKIRQESVEKIDELCSKSTLVPIIYRSQFIAKVDNVSYFMLDKK